MRIFSNYLKYKSKFKIMQKKKKVLIYKFSELCKIQSYLEWEEHKKILMAISEKLHRTNYRS